MNAPPTISLSKISRFSASEELKNVIAVTKHAPMTETTK